MKLIESAAKIIGYLFAIGGFIAFVTLNTTDEQDLRVFSLYALGNGLLDLFSIAAVGALVWLVLRSKGIRALFKSPGTTLRAGNGGLQLRNSLAAVLSIALVVALVLNGFFLLRARAYFWRFLLQESYVEGTISRVDELGDSGYIHDAYALTVKAGRVLTDEADQTRLSNRFSDLAGRVEASRRLSQRSLRPDPRSWNPITQRDYYFANAEAVRLNPQNYQSADILGNLHERVLTGIRADIELVCGEGQAVAFHTVSLREVQLFIRGVDTDCESEAFDWLEGIWRAQQVESILELSNDVRDHPL